MINLLSLGSDFIKLPLHVILFCGGTAGRTLRVRSVCLHGIVYLYKLCCATVLFWQMHGKDSFRGVRILILSCQSNRSLAEANDLAKACTNEQYEL